jgi:hypothetical protein
MVPSEAEGRAEALRRIAACRTTREDELDLGALQLNSLDEILKPLCELTWLRRVVPSTTESEGESESRR